MSQSYWQKGAGASPTLPPCPNPRRGHLFDSIEPCSMSMLCYSNNYVGTRAVRNTTRARVVPRCVLQRARPALYRHVGQESHQGPSVCE